MILVVAQIVIRLTWLYDSEDFSEYDLICYFKHQPRVKIRCDRKYVYNSTNDG